MTSLESVESCAEILQTFDLSLSTAREVLSQMDDRKLLGMWTLLTVTG